ncbi:MAG: protein kinase domain-containing protein [Gemmatimonadaceae bacterium]
MKRLSLAARIALASAGIVIVVLALALFVARRQALASAQMNIGDRLDITQERVGELLTANGRELTGRLAGYAESPDVRATIDAGTDYLDRVETAAEQSGADWVQLVSREGVRLAKSDDPSAPPDTLIGSALIRKALDGEQPSAFGVDDDSVLIEVVAVPTSSSNKRVIGAFMAAKQVPDSIARKVGQQTDSEILFYVLDREGAPRVAAATDGARSASAVLLARLSEQLQADAGGAEQAGEAAGSVIPGGRDSLERVVLGNETWVGRRAPLYSAGGVPIGGYLALRSLDRELAATGFPDLQTALLIAGAGGLLLALFASVITARQVARPVTQLANATRRAAEGDYQATIPEGGSDEIGTLASAFRRLLADLKDKQALVDFLSSAAPAATRMQTMLAAPSAEDATTLKIPTGAVGVNVLAPGQTFGNRYEIKSVLGIGGMGMVYKANDKELGEVLAIKTLKPDLIASDSNALERFKSEIKLARRIAHRNVVRTYDLGEIGGQYYITMEYVEGKSLKDLIKERGRLPASVVLPIAKQICRALEVSHEEGVIHRDIKPQNMVVQGDGVLKVMDFGIARLVSRPKEAGHTEKGMVVGTPEYMAPEHLLGDEIDARADLYATGVVLYECLVGSVPITADTPITLIARVLEEVPRPPKDVKPDIPKALSDLVVWTLEKDREKRPRSAAELHARLDEIVLR